MATIPRLAATRVSTALKDTPAVLINGPRQAGKTTLVRELISDQRTYITLDDDVWLNAARNDPAGVVRSKDRLAIDEIQRAPDLLLAIKKSIDEDRRPGRFLLTGSANVLTLPTVAESLAGRMEIVTLLPLSTAELVEVKPRFLSRVFDGSPPAEKRSAPTVELEDRVLRGGYPEMISRADPQRRRQWARDYLRAIVERDVRDVAGIQLLDQVPKLTRVLAQHAAQLVNFTQIGGQLGLDDKTTRKYITVLEQLFLIRQLQPWSNNRLKRLIKTPRLHFHDSGLLAATAGVTSERLEKDRSSFGPLLETFVLSELVKQTTWADDAYDFYYYRDKDKNEVDIVIENSAGEVVGVEVKSAASVSASDFAGLRKLADAAGRDFIFGVVLYDGASVAPFGEKFAAAPVRSLWA